MALSNITNEELSEIQSFYSRKIIFITGASGFLGKLLVEKLLRSCKGVKHIYVLLREKRGKSPQERIKEIYDVPAFQMLKSDEPEFLEKISILEGDLMLPNLGLTETDQTLIKDSVDCIFHVGATVRFDEKIKKAAYVNVRSVRDLLEIAKQMKQLKSFVYVSTAYSNCIRKDIGEIFYDPIINGKSLLELVELLDDNTLDEITPTLLKDNPNTYVFTKCIAEEVIKANSQNLPIAIVRPSIVISTYKEPIPGWIDNFYGPTSILVGITLGLLRTLYAKTSNLADMVPVDFVINAMMVAAWNAGDSNCISDRNVEQHAPESIIFNYTSGARNPITWGHFQDLAKEFAMKVPSPLIVWYPLFDYHENYYLHRLIAFLFQTVPAYIVDFFARCLGKRARFVEIVTKVDKVCDAISYFTMNQWYFSDDNTQRLWRRLNSTDKKLYNFDITSMTWRDFFSTYIVGGRVYLMKDPLDTIPQGRRKFIAVRIGHYLVVAILCLLLYKLVSVFYGMCFE